MFLEPHNLLSLLIRDSFSGCEKREKRTKEEKRYFEKMSSPTNSDSDDDSIGLSSDALAALQSVLGVAGGSEAGPSDQDAFLAQLLHSRRMMEDSSDDDGDDDEEEGEEDDNDNDMLPGESHADYYRRKFPERYTDSSSTSDNNNTAAVVQNTTSRDKNAKNVALITVEDEYVSALIISAFKETKKWDILTEKKKKLTSNSESDSKENNDYDLHWGEYEDIEWFSKGFESGKTIVSCYYNRKGLIRKGHLASILEKWQTKYKGSRQPIAPKSWVLRLPILSSSKREGEVVENDENPNVVIPTNIQKILDDTIQNSNFPGFSTSSSSPVKEIYILKPSVTNQANGIRLVSSNQELYNALYTADEIAKAGDFVLQTYIPPLLLDERKFHLRVFMLCIGNLTCYIHQDFLAIFSLEKYDQTSIENTRAHLTNIAHQEVLSEDDQHRCMRRFDECKEDLTLLTNIDDENEAQERIQATKKRVYEITGELMQAVSSELTFTQKPNCFELFGLDFMIDPDWNVWLLEANAEPDLSKAGDRLQYVIDGMVKETLDLVVQNQGGGVKEGEEAKTDNFVKVYERKGRSF